MGYYDEYLRELAAERTRMRRELQRRRGEAERALRGVYAARGLSFSGIAQRQLGELEEKFQEAAERGGAAISQEIAKVRAAEKAERQAANAARAQALGTLIGTGVGALAGSAVPGLGTALGAQLGALAGSVAGGLIGGGGGYAPAYTGIPSSIGAAIEALETEKLKRYMQETLDAYRSAGKEYRRP